MGGADSQALSAAPLQAQLAELAEGDVLAARDHQLRGGEDLARCVEELHREHDAAVLQSGDAVSRAVVDAQQSAALGALHLEAEGLGQEGGVARRLERVAAAGARRQRRARVVIDGHRALDGGHVAADAGEPGRGEGALLEVLGDPDHRADADAVARDAHRVRALVGEGLVLHGGVSAGGCAVGTVDGAVGSEVTGAAVHSVVLPHLADLGPRGEVGAQQRLRRVAPVAALLAAHRA